MRFEWDAEKDAANRNKHGVSFELAVQVFDDPKYSLIEDRIDEHGEQRWHAIGMVEAVLLLVVHVYRSTQYDEEIIRIISARKASEREGRAYFG